MMQNTVNGSDKRVDVVKKQKKAPLPKKYIVRNVLILVLSVVLLVGGMGCIYVDGILSAGHYAANSGALDTPITASTIDSGTVFNSAGANQVNSLLKDDAVTNILMIGVDDYQKDDPIGRSDSMMIISIDNRHKKMKMTSFMRDIYLAIPNNGSNKLNAAYHFGAYDAVNSGKAKAGDITSCNAGAQLCIQTLELNFGMTIDRYVVVRDSVFDDVVGILGGVDVNMTRDETIAINKYSGAGCTLEEKNGIQHLDGAQAHYFGRIRATEIANVNGHHDDEGRAERQRMVVNSVINKFKTSDIPTLSNLASRVLAKVYTNFSRDEIYKFLLQSGTILKYPTSQNQVPAEGNYKTTDIYIGSSTKPSSIVQIKDNKKVVSDVLTFLYEKDKPDVSHIGLAALAGMSPVSSVAGSSAAVTSAEVGANN